MRKIFYIKILIFLVILSGVGFAQATLIDFRGFNPNLTSTQQTHTEFDVFGDLDLKFTAFSFIKDDIRNPYGSLFSDGSGVLYWDSTDGFGARLPSYETDEIENPEYLQIDFSSTVFVSNFLLTDLFTESRNSYQEEGAYSTDGGTTWLNFFAPTSSNSNGAFTLTIGQAVDSILFTAPGEFYDNQNHEYSIAGMNIAPVPEPATMLLFGTGLLGLAGLRLRKKK